MFKKLILKNSNKSSKNLVKASKKSLEKRCCPVLCETTGTKFKSIAELARTLGLNSWTIGLKMETAGYFVDSNNNKYIRLRPMNTRVKYAIQRPDMVKTCSYHKRVNNKVVNKTTTNIKSFIEQKPELNKAISQLKELTIKQIEEGKYIEASQFLEALTILNR